MSTGWEAFFQEVVSFLRQVQLEHSSQDHLDFYLERLETVIPAHKGSVMSYIHLNQMVPVKQLFFVGIKD